MITELQMIKLFVSIVRVALLLAIVVFAGSSALAGEKVLYQFPGGNRGNYPQFGVVFDSKGNAYGTTYYGGRYGWGIIFELEKSNHGWTEQVLYNFLGSSDGFNPAGNLLIDAAGNLYGTTQSGGTHTGCLQGEEYCGGTVFELTQSNGSWKHIVLYNFCSDSGCSDGAVPNGLVFDKAGNLYGTTGAGGQQCEGGCGTVYELTPSNGSWTEKVLYAFDDTGNGFFPAAGITIDQSGNLYGTTYAGGGYNYGLVFMLKPTKRGWQEVMLYAFDGSTNNKDANGYLTLDAAGNIFGTTSDGYNGCTYECGMVFRLSRSRGQWVESAVYTFDGTHGASPNPGLILDSAGNFYGSTILGGKNNFGEVFELKPGKTWTIKLLHSFAGVSGDENPNPGLIFGPDGGLYGTTPQANNNQYDGEVFEVLP
jgi:uncharacterized repeat protein (TIGR03803 family)